MSGVEVPPGVILFEDPPLHDLHRRLLSKVFTPRRMEEIEPLTRQFCVRALDPLIGSGRFDFIEDIGAMVPMRTIGYLLGIPEEGQQPSATKRPCVGAEGRHSWGVPPRRSKRATSCSSTTSTGGRSIPPTI